ncbi:MAG: GNAT family N-acetyltransferase [Pseudomonadota bacterium]|nr:GNAT family N-acetyltransferase [Pseudomonadota bacterium]
MSIVFESIAEPHLKPLSDLHVECFDNGWSPSVFSEFLSWAGTEIVLARDLRKNTIVGFILYRMLFEDCEIITICVEQNCRRRGVATRLIKSIRKQLNINQISRIIIEVDKINLPARRFYQALKFKQIGKRQNYYKHLSGYSDAIVMQMDLNNTILEPHNFRS